jgi:hypothetical protein
MSSAAMPRQDEDSEPVEGADAGPAEEFFANRRLEQVRSAHERASELLHEAQAVVASAPEEAEQLSRAALLHAAHAYWFAEGTAGSVVEHEYLHEIGHWTRERLGCELDWDGQNYSTSCPVKLADRRCGFSPGFVARIFVFGLRPGPFRVSAQSGPTVLGEGANAVWTLPRLRE